MKMKPKMKLTLDDSIAAAYQAWGACRGEKLVQWASNPRLAVCREQPHFSIPSAKGKFV